MDRQLTASRQEILRLLRFRGEMTVDELSRLMGISSVAVRQHLEVLTAANLVTSLTERRPIGRPRRVYALTDAADDLFPKNYHILAHQILDHLLERDGPKKVAEVFEGRRQRLEAQYAERVRGKSLRDRVAAVAKMQDENGYMSDWEQREDGSFVLREHNCAICKVARNFPQACQKELELFTNLLDADVSRDQHMAKGDCMCSYVIRPKPSA
jgi:predicted ArsR family transcriptional regulator